MKTHGHQPAKSATVTLRADRDPKKAKGHAG